MGRGNFCASGDLAMRWYIDYDQFTSEDGEHDELFQHEMVNYEMVNQIMKRYPSFWKTNAWIHRDAHALLENKLFYIGIADMKIRWRFSLAAKMSLVPEEWRSAILRATKRESRRFCFSCLARYTSERAHGLQQGSRRRKPTMLYDTIREATYEWGREFNAVPRGIVEKLIKADGGAGNAISEVTPPSVGNYVYVFDKEAHGIVVQYLDDDKYLIELDDGEQVELNEDSFEVEYDDYLPMWNTMWAFNDFCDNYWLENGGLQIMADCGFRIYEQEDYGYIFGIDGWHKEDAV